MDYDMMGVGLGSYSGDGLGALLPTMEQAKAGLMAGAVGAGGILVTATVLSKLDAYQPATGALADPMNWRRAKGVLAVVAGIMVGRGLYDRSPNASMAATGAIVGLGLADLAATWIPANDDGTPMVRTGLAGGHLSGADLRALEQAVTSATPAWGMHGTVAQTQALRGLGAPVTSVTELGAQPAYQGYLS